MLSLIISFRTNFKMGLFVSPENKALVFQFLEILKKFVFEAPLVGVFKFTRKSSLFYFISPFCYIVVL